MAAVLTTTVAVAALLLVGPGPDRGGSGGAEASDWSTSRYTVRPGDTIASVAGIHGLEVDVLLEAHGLTLADSLRPGRVLEIPPLPSEGRSWPAPLTGDTQRAQLWSTFQGVADDRGLPVSLLQAVTWEVSRWDTTPVDEDGDIGIGRLDPEIVAWLNQEVVDENLDPRAVEANIGLAAAYLAHLLEVTDGDHAAAIASWYAGEVTPFRGTWDLDVVQFVRRVLLRAAGFSAPPPASATTVPPDPTTTTTTTT